MKMKKGVAIINLPTLLLVPSLATGALALALTIRLKCDCYHRLSLNPESCSIAGHLTEIDYQCWRGPDRRYLVEVFYSTQAICSKFGSNRA